MSFCCSDEPRCFYSGFVTVKFSRSISRLPVGMVCGDTLVASSSVDLRDRSSFHNNEHSSCERHTSRSAIYQNKYGHFRKLRLILGVLVWSWSPSYRTALILSIPGNVGCGIDEGSQQTKAIYFTVWKRPRITISFPRTWILSRWRITEGHGRRWLHLFSSILYDASGRIRNASDC